MKRKQRLIVTQDAVGWVIRGEGVNFFCPCADMGSALFIASRIRNECYPRARVEVREVQPITHQEMEDRRYERMEERDRQLQDIGPGGK